MCVDLKIIVLTKNTRNAMTFLHITIYINLKCIHATQNFVFNKNRHNESIHRKLIEWLLIGKGTCGMRNGDKLNKSWALHEPKKRTCVN